MAFEVTKYEADDGTIHPIRLNTKTTAVSGNAAPTGATTSSIFAKVSKSNREFGIRPRRVTGVNTVEVTQGEETYTIRKRVTVPILTSAVYDGNAFDIGGTFEYDGDTYTVQSKQAEDY